ncbi:MAG: cell division protein FtsH [Deltaproteobacteria bacterium HGW-Deltaproteobacteria-21]|nr:MAG: cell division protein FtsH [Deltaproteobacteria bacterium HGW-Deltaproteobacteria-21]
MRCLMKPAITFLLALAVFFFGAGGADAGEIPYGEFKRLLKQGKIEEVVIGPETIQGYMKGSGTEATRRFETVRVGDPDLISDLQASGTMYSGSRGSAWGSIPGWMISLGIILLIWFILSRRSSSDRGLMGFGKSKAKLYTQEYPKVSFSEVAGLEEATDELKEIVEFLKAPQRFQLLGGRLPKGVLLVGSPGTGKTLLARAVAGEAGVPFFSATGSDFVEMYVGVGASRVRDLFRQAREMTPCLIFIDELDALGKARSSHPMGDHQEREQTLNQLLSEMDGFDPKQGLIVMAATNRPEILDQALLRPGRFDVNILVDRPDVRGREAILEIHSKKIKMADDVNLKILASRTIGMVGADLGNLVNQAALLAARKNKQAVDMADFEEAIDRVQTGTQKKKWVISKKERRMVAYHELGHAITATCLPHADPVHKVTIIPRSTGSLGHTLQLPAEDRYLMTKSELIDRMTILLGGRAAEELVFGEHSTGAHNDLDMASTIARKMITEYGMSRVQGPIAFEKDQRSIFLDSGGGTLKTYSQETAREIDDEIKQLIWEAYEKAKSLLTEKRAALDRIVRILLEKEILEGDELKRLLEIYDSPVHGVRILSESIPPETVSSEIVPQKASLT